MVVLDVVIYVVNISRYQCDVVTYVVILPFLQLMFYLMLCILLNLHPHVNVTSLMLLMLKFMLKL